MSRLWFFGFDGSKRQVVVTNAGVTRDKLGFFEARGRGEGHWVVLRRNGDGEDLFFHCKSQNRSKNSGRKRRAKRGSPLAKK